MRRKGEQDATEKGYLKFDRQPKLEFVLNEY